MTLSGVKRPTYKLMVGGRCIQTATVATVLIPGFRNYLRRGYRPAIHWTGEIEGGSLQGTRTGDPDHRQQQVEWVSHPLHPDTPCPGWAQTVQRVIKESAT